MSLKTSIASFALVAALLGGAGALAADTYKVDAVHSAVIFQVKHLNVGNFYGRFNHVEGTVVLDEAKPEASSLHFTVKADSVDTANAKRDTHLKSPDFFDAKQFPTIEFKSKSVKKTGDGTFDVTGDLSLHGVTKEETITFKLTGAGPDPWGNERKGGEAHFKVKRSDYKMTFMPDGIGDEVHLIVSVEGIKEKAK